MSAALCVLSFVASAQGEPATAVVGSVPASGTAIVKELAPGELKTMMGSNPVFIFDCNEPDTFSEAHVPGAMLTVYDEVTTDKLPPDRNATLVFYCYSPQCPAGAMAAHTAITLGFAQVYCMPAGITGWQDAGLKTDP
ncbi:MAG: rhodanese-like domain-containing protein [Flavobacteriales bacterium]